MLFNSLEYLFFLPVVVWLYFLSPYRARNALLLLASYVFYMCWEPGYALLIGLSTVTIYAGGRWMGRTEAPAGRKAILAACLSLNLGILLVFKYFNFFSESLGLAFSSLGLTFHLPHLNLLLPVGISFYTFQSLSYAIDVYRGDVAPERSLTRFAVYVAFFPQLVAGPIERSTRLLPQFFEKIDFDYQKAADGMRLIMWGFFKKIVIADRLALLVDPVYLNPDAFDGGTLLLTIYAFAFQIYCDFSGYSDIAIGSALLMGYRLMTNFDRPYFAVSIPDFWRRWHISLTSWFRDYLYIPLGGNRVSRGRVYANILVVFLISGLWHGAAFTFVAWGGVHGAMLALARLTAQSRARVAERLGLGRIRRLHHLARVVLTFHLVVLAWVFFRAANLGDAWTVLRRIGQDAVRLVTGAVPLKTLTDFSWLLPKITRSELWISLAVVVLLMLVEFSQGTRSFARYLGEKPAPVRWAVYLVTAWVILIFGKYGANSKEFVYFQF